MKRRLKENGSVGNGGEVDRVIFTLECTEQEVKWLSSGYQNCWATEAPPTLWYSHALHLAILFCRIIFPTKWFSLSPPCTLNPLANVALKRLTWWAKWSWFPWFLPGGHPGIAQLMFYILLMWMTTAQFPSAQEGKEYHQTFQHLPILPPTSLSLTLYKWPNF